MHALDSLMQGLKGKPENYYSSCSKLNSCPAMCFHQFLFFFFSLVLGAVFYLPVDHGRWCPQSGPRFFFIWLVNVYRFDCKL